MPTFCLFSVPKTWFRRMGGSQNPKNVLLECKLVTDGDELQFKTGASIPTQR